MARFTIFGSSGFIGRHAAGYLGARGHEVVRVGRSEVLPAGTSLGHALYCIGLTANFRTNLTDTARAHVCVLCDVIDSYSYESFLYLSSTRVYMGASETREETAMTVDPTSVDHVYNLSKLTGEALCLARRDRAFRVARIANVVGPGDASVNFLPSLVEEARREGSLTIRTSPQSTKDYVDIDDVCRLLEKIALNGSERIYNVASGVNVTNGEIAGLIEKRLGAKVQFVPRPPTTTFPPIDVRRVRNEFGFEPIPFHTSFDKLFGDTPAEASDDHDN